jgi:hypothetical protein
MMILLQLLIPFPIFREGISSVEEKMDPLEYNTAAPTSSSQHGIFINPVLLAFTA